MNLGPYTLLGELGRGGAGVVYHARDPNGREVAVKLLGRKGQDSLDRFQREARLHQQLGLQAGFVPFLDLGVAPAGHYLVMPLLRGGTLRERLRRGRLSISDALELGFRLATALGRAHALGIVHRDIKPDNVLFSHDGLPFLADLGLAKHFRHDVSGASQSVVLSRAGESRGTVSYMAPEQLQDAARVGPPADVFALGALLYECLSGEAAFSGATTVELMVCVAEAKHVPIRKRRPDCPPWFGALIESTLSADSARRPPDATALAEAIAAGPPALDPSSARSLALPLALMAATLLAAGLGAAYFASTPGPGPSPSLAAQPSPSATAAPSSSPAPESSPTPVVAKSSFPQDWQPFLQTPRTRLAKAWRLGEPALAVATHARGASALSSRELFLLASGEPLATTPPRPSQRFRDARFGSQFGTLVLGEGVTLLGALEQRLTLFGTEDGRPRAEVKLDEPAQLAAPGFRGVNALVAHGRRLVAYGLPLTKKKPSPPRPLLTATGEISAVAGAGSTALVGYDKSMALLNIIGRTKHAYTYSSPVAALTYQPGARPLVATRAGSLHSYDPEGAPSEEAIETGLRGVIALTAGGDLAALASPEGLVLVDLATREVIDQIDLRATKERLTSLALSSEGEALVVGFQGGLVLRFELKAPGGTPTLAPKTAWGDRRGRHAAPVLAVSAESGRLVSADGSGAMLEWDPTTGQTRRGIMPSRRLASLVPAGPGRVLTLAAEKVVRIWDLASESEALRLPTAGTPLAAALSPDRTKLAVIDYERGLELWDLSERRLLKRLTLEGREAPRKVALLPEGLVLLGYGSGLLRLFDPTKREEVWSKQGDQPIHALHVEEAGGRALVVYAKRSVSLLKLPSGREIAQLQLAQSGDAPVSASLRGDRVLIGTKKGMVELFEVPTGRRLWRRKSLVGAQTQVALLSDRRAFVGGAGRRVTLLHLDEPGEDWPLAPANAGPASELAFPGAKGLVVSLAPRAFCVWDANSGKLVNKHPTGVMSAGKLSASRGLTIGLGAGQAPGFGLDLWQLDPKKGRMEAPVRLGKGRRSAIALSASGEFLASSLPGRPGVELFRGVEARQRPATKLSPRVLALSAEGKLLALSDFRNLETWDLATRTRTGSLRVTAARIVFLRSQAPLLVIGKLHGEVLILDGRTLTQRAEFKVRGKVSLVAMAPSPDGEHLAFALEDGALEIWHALGARRVARLDPQDSADLASSLAFSEDGRELAVGTTRGRIAIFDLSSLLR